MIEAILLLLLMFIVIIYIYNVNVYNSEHFNVINYGPYRRYPYGIYPYFGGYTNFPFNNTQLGLKSYMNHDLRGDPLIIPKYYSPWNFSSAIPIYNRPI